MLLHTEGESSSNAATRVREPSPRTETCNVVIFGEVGAGKSSLVNLITEGRVPHEISPDAMGRTAENTIHNHEIASRSGTLKLKLFDTPGLGEGSEGTVPAHKAQEYLEKLLQDLKGGDGIHLLVYCVRNARKTTALRRNYDLFRSKLKEVPIALVVTGLEYQNPVMEEWWTKNEKYLSEQQMSFAGHACITAVTLRDDDGASVKERHAQSYRTVCDLIDLCRLPSVKGFHAMGEENLVKTISTNTVTESTVSTKNIVVFGETGVGISSLVNLIAGHEVARTSPDMESCTTHWKEHAITFDAYDYKVFDTAGLREPQLGMKEYVDVIKDAYNLITKLKREGRVDLLIYCVRAGAITATLQTNYRLFHEWLCEKKVPIVLVLTGLEREPNDMEDWWTRNRHIFVKYDIHVARHACVTAANRLYGRDKKLYEESHHLIRDLIRRCTQGEGDPYTGSGACHMDATRDSWRPTEGDFKSPPKKQDIVTILSNCGMPRREAKALASSSAT